MIDLDQIIKDNEIIAVDIRYMGDDHYWSCISHSAQYFLKHHDDFFKNDFLIDNNITLKSLSKDRYFIDPFLSHKTLVFLTDKSPRGFLVSSYLDKFINNNKYYYYFEITNKKHIKNTKNINDLHHMGTQFDAYRDFKTEIMTSLLEMGINIVSFYESNNKSYFVIESMNNPLFDFDNYQKIKYGILMLANIYEISINMEQGIFCDPINM